MTTSILSVHAGTLTGQDLQVLKDFALNAPYEWRKLFEALVDLAEATTGLELNEIQDAVAEKEKLVEKVKVLEDQNASLESDNSKKQNTIDGMQEASEKVLKALRVLNAEVVGATTTSRWQAQMMSVLAEFEEEMK